MTERHETQSSQDSAPEKDLPTHSRYTAAAGQRYFDTYKSELLSQEIGQRKAAKLNPYLDPSWSIADFGCSAGQITTHLLARDKTGIEINEPAVRYAREVNHLRIVASLGDLLTSSFDAVVTHHALEHVDHPLEALVQIHRVLKPGGRLIVIVPGEAGWYPRHGHWRDEINKHLYSWTPLSLGNLCVKAGFAVETAKTLTYRDQSRFMGPLKNTHIAGRLMGLLRQVLNGETEVLVVARKPGDPLSAGDHSAACT